MMGAPRNAAPQQYRTRIPAEASAEAMLTPCSPGVQSRSRPEPPGMTHRVTIPANRLCPAACFRCPRPRATCSAPGQNHSVGAAHTPVRWRWVSAHLHGAAGDGASGAGTLWCGGWCARPATHQLARPAASLPPGGEDNRRRLCSWEPRRPPPAPAPRVGAGWKLDRPAVVPFHSVLGCHSFLSCVLGCRCRGHH